MSARDYACHKLIGTPLEPVFRGYRGIRKILHLLRHPELTTLFLEDGYFDETLKRLIPSPDVNCIDVGAHLGTILHKLITLAPQGQHFGIEPTPEKAEWLRKKYLQAHILEVALHEKDTEMTLKVNTGKTGCNKLSFNNQSANKNNLTVKCVQLDNAIDNELPIHLIKIDIVGAEYYALRGAKKLIAKWKPYLIVEITKEGLDDFSITPEKIFPLLNSELDYQVYTLEDWLHGKSAIEFNEFEKFMHYPYKAYNFLAIPRQSLSQQSMN